DEWLESAKRSFGELAESAEKAGTRLFVENVFDENPEHLLRLREAVGSPRLLFCLDAGHAALFSRVPVHRWAEAFGRGIGLMHVHDNRGTRDDHLPVGEGTINFRGVLLAAVDAGARPILTVEPHRREHFARSVSGLRAILSTLP
ncbi:MAG: Xylose isomerase protein barrel, partial [Deltaproteobacteria bacterium]|nr:Xylose isomerase protein barrel [Deltaproteobacteria bacterium]